jgi:hypothetical protein
VRDEFRFAPPLNQSPLIPAKAARLRPSGFDGLRRPLPAEALAKAGNPGTRTAAICREGRTLRARVTPRVASDQAGRPVARIQLRNTSQYVPAARNAAHNFAASTRVSAPIRTRAAPVLPKIPRMTTCGSRSPTIAAYLDRHSRKRASACAGVKLPTTSTPHGLMVSVLADASRFAACRSQGTAFRERISGGWFGLRSILLRSDRSRGVHRPAFRPEAVGGRPASRAHDQIRHCRRLPQGQGFQIHDANHATAQRTWQLLRAD